MQDDRLHIDSTKDTFRAHLVWLKDKFGIQYVIQKKQK